MLTTTEADPRPSVPGRAGCWLRRFVIGAVAYLILGNLLILGASLILQTFGPDGVRPAGAAGINHLRVIDDRLWRGSAPTPEGYRSLAANGVTTIVDLRAGVPAEELDAVRALGFRVVHLPLRDGQTPSAALVRAVLDVVEQSPGKVFLHCQAGVGRTGSVAAAYSVWTGEASGAGALGRNLAIGPPTLEQIVFTLHLSDGGAKRIPPPIVAASRVLDAPRLLWNRLLG